MDSSISTWKLFERLVCKILEANKYKVEKHAVRGDQGFDLLATHDGERWAIEVKYYRTARAQPVLVEKAAIRVARNGVEANVFKGMLVVSCILPDKLRASLESKYKITLVDRLDLRNWSAAHPELSEQLEALLEILPTESLPTLIPRTDPTLSSKPLGRRPPRRDENKGTQLCKELKGIDRGKASWARYEKVCEEILKYLFPNDLTGWHSQLRTDDGLNRYDYVCRVRPTTEFWNFIIDHINSRYVLFEFKNYTSEINQGQILTTEKYLLKRGLRRVAIIMTRAGADDHAVAMTQGAMREQGKLMLIVNDEQVCEMLHMKERGDDPTDFLFELADNFLLKLPR